MLSISRTGVNLSYSCRAVLCCSLIFFVWGDDGFVELWSCFKHADITYMHTHAHTYSTYIPPYTQNPVTSHAQSRKVPYPTLSLYLLLSSLLLFFRFQASFCVYSCIRVTVFSNSRFSWIFAADSSQKKTG